jgi:hypothetical protein
MRSPRSDAWSTRSVVLAGTAIAVILAIVGVRWPQLFNIPGVGSYLSPPAAPEGPPVHYPYVELLKLILAALLGIVVSAVHRHTRHGKPQSSSLEHAQILLCISGAIIMIIIGNSLARAFGIAGGASIVRFRTPVDDPKDAMVLFLLLGVGMACGLAAFGLAILASLFLCGMLLVLSKMEETTTREMMIELVSAGREFPSEQVQSVLRQRTLSFEQREVSHGENMTVRYFVLLEPYASFEDLCSALIAETQEAIRTVSWVKPKKNVPLG